MIKYKKSISKLIRRLIKINLDTLDQVWSTQLAVDQTAERPEDAEKLKTESSARGLSCEVTRNGDIVWVAGNVGMNSIMKNEPFSRFDLLSTLFAEPRALRQRHLHW